MQARPEQLDRISERLEHTAIIQERMMGRLDALEKWRDERERERERAEERKDERVEKQPDDVRNMISAYGGCVGQLVFAAISSLSTVLSVVALVITLTHLQH